MRHIGTVASRELRSLFVSPVAYVILTLFALLAGFFFLAGVLQFNEYAMRLQQFQAIEQLEQMNLNDFVLVPFYGAMSVVLLFLIPGITMGLFASEKANGTDELLLTSPLTIWDIVLGKYLAAALFVLLVMALLCLYPGILFMYGNPEFGKSAAATLGLLLLSLAYAAVGAFASSVTRSQIVAFFLAFVILLFLLLMSVLADLGAVGAGVMADVLRYISTADHFEQMQSGLIDTGDLAYFALLIGVSLLLAKMAIESVRWR